MCGYSAKAGSSSVRRCTRGQQPLAASRLPAQMGVAQVEPARLFIGCAARSALQCSALPRAKRRWMAERWRKAGAEGSLGAMVRQEQMFRMMESRDMSSRGSEFILFAEHGLF